MIGVRVNVDDIDAIEEDGNSEVGAGSSVRILIAFPGSICRRVPLMVLHVSSLSVPHHQKVGAEEPNPPSPVQGYRFANTEDSLEAEN
jgi:hypothetical protein